MSKVDVKIATITMSVQLPKCQLNLMNIGKYLTIDDDIIGIKYNYADISVMKGSYSTTIYKKAKVKDTNRINKQLFYNQITLIVNNNGNHVNVKLFGNGSLHLTGCKHVDEGYEIVKILYKKLDLIRNVKDTILLTKDTNNILLDKDNLVYSYTDYRIIGHTKCKNTYVINKKEYEIDQTTEMFISKKVESKRKRPILNLDGVEIGNLKIELLKNKNKFYNKTSNIYYDYASTFIYYNNDMIIGKLNYDIDKNKITRTECSDVLEVVYDCNPFADKNYNIQNYTEEDYNLDINCINIYFNLGFKINRTRLYKKFTDANYICKYKPESYSGIKLIYKIPIDYLINSQDTSQVTSGNCTCNLKCTCRNITFLIFQSGNVIATGFKNNLQITDISSKFIDICNGLKEHIEPNVSNLVV